MVEAGDPALDPAPAEGGEAEGGQPLLRPLLHLAYVLPHRPVTALQSRGRNSLIKNIPIGVWRGSMVSATF